MGSSPGTGGPGGAGTWARLSALLGETWPHAGGSEIGLGRLAIDTGYEAPAVYGWVRRMGSGQVAAVKGVDGFSRKAPVSGPRRTNSPRCQSARPSNRCLLTTT